MNKHFKTLISFLFLLLIVAANSFAQTKDELQKKKDSLLKEIEQCKKISTKQKNPKPLLSPK